MKERLGIVFAVFGAVHVAVGCLMAAAPKAFFEEIGPYGVRNDHYTRDLSTFTLALGLVALVAWKRPSWRVPVAAYALIQFALHSLNHLIDIGEADPEALGPINFISLALTAGLLAYMLRAALRSERSAG